MKVTTLRLPEDLYSQLTAEADEQDMSFSEYARELLRQRGRRSNTNTNTQPNTELLERLDDLEQRIASIEMDRREQSIVEDIEGDSDQETSSTGHEDGNVADIVDDHAAREWDDSEERLNARKEAAQAVLSRALDSYSVGKSDVEDLYDEYSVPGQNFDTWWRQNCRDLLKEHGEYDQGTHGYRVSVE